MSNVAGAALITRIREVLESSYGSFRTVPANRFAGDFPAGLADSELVRRAFVQPRVRVEVKVLGRHPASPPITGNVIIYNVQVLVTSARAIVRSEQITPDDLSTEHANAVVDADIIRQALEWPGNLLTTEAGTATGLVSGMLKHDTVGSQIAVQRTVNQGAQLLLSTHSFNGQLQVAAAAVVAPTSITASGTVSIGQTITIAQTGGSSGQYVYLYRDGISARSLGTMPASLSTTYTVTDQDIGPSFTFVINGVTSNALVYAGPAASLTSIGILRDSTHQTQSGAQIAAWADAGGGSFGTLNGVVSSPYQTRFLGQSALQFGNSQTTQMTAASSGTLNDLNGSGSFHRFYVVRPDAGIQTESDVRNCDQILGDANTYYSIGFQKSAGTIYINGGYYHSGAWHQLTLTSALAMTQSTWYLVEEKYDNSTGTYSIQVNDNGFVSTTTGGVPPSLTGAISVGKNWQNEYANFSVAFIGGSKALQSASVTADIRAYLKWLYLTRVDYTPVTADWWGNGYATTRNNYPIRSSEALLVGDTTSSTVRANITIYSTPVNSTNDMEFNVAMATGSDSPTVWTTVQTSITGTHTDGTGWMTATLAPMSIPGTGTRRVWIIPPAMGSGIEYTVQSLQIDQSTTWTPVAQPSTGALLALDAMGGASLGNSNIFGYYYISGVRQDGGYATARTACMARLTQATSGQSPGTVVCFTPQTNDFRNSILASDAALQAALLISDIKATLPTWKVVYVTLCPLAASFAGQSAWRTTEATGATGADLVVDGSTVWDVTDVSSDGVHPYLSGSIKAKAAIISAVQSLGRSGKMIAMWCGNSLTCGSAMYSSSNQNYVHPNIEGLPALLRTAGW